MPLITVDGIVAMRDQRPYVRLFRDGQQMAQFSMAEARNIAHDILTQCARAEADAMIHRFFSHSGYPEGAGLAIMLEFRKFRRELDGEPVERSLHEPDDDTRGAGAH
jgi:hypothetical protein